MCKYSLSEAVVGGEKIRRSSRKVAGMPEISILDKPGEKLTDLIFRGGDLSLLAYGFSASPSTEGSDHFFA